MARLIGAPAGYIGYEEGGRLTETIRRRPYCVVLFDEIEKAHPDVFNILLQILEEGELTDAAGKRVNFRNTIIILTSNLGVSEFNRHAKTFGFETESKEEKQRAEAACRRLRQQIEGSLKETFRPEFLNRISKIIIFHPLTQADIQKITDLKLKELAQNLAKNHRIIISFDRELKKISR